MIRHRDSILRTRSLKSPCPFRARMIANRSVSGIDWSPATPCSILRSQASKSSVEVGTTSAADSASGATSWPINPIRTSASGAGVFRQIDRLQTIAIWLEWRVFGGKQGSQDRNVILRPDLVGKLCKLDLHPPANAFPVLASTSELQRFRAFPCVRLNDADSQYPRVHEREDQVARRHLTHQLIERIAGAVGVALRRPQISDGRDHRPSR